MPSSHAGPASLRCRRCSRRQPAQPAGRAAAQRCAAAAWARGTGSCRDGAASGRGCWGGRRAAAACWRASTRSSACPPPSWAASSPSAVLRKRLLASLYRGGGWLPSVRPACRLCQPCHRRTGPGHTMAPGGRKLRGRRHPQQQHGAGGAASRLNGPWCTALLGHSPAASNVSPALDERQQQPTRFPA